MMIDDVTLGKLLYTKRLFTHGYEHMMYDTEFDRMIAIHNFDNAIEILLKSVASKYNIHFKRPLYITFPKLWSEVNSKYKSHTGKALPKQTEVFQLHEDRSDVQHWGISHFTLEVCNRYAVYTLDFIKTILKDIFDLDYDDLYSASFVKDDKIRGLLIDAEKAIKGEKFEECIKLTSIAFAYAKHEERKKLDLPIIPFSLLDRFMHPGDIGTIESSIREIFETLTTLALGINYKDYARFSKNTPVVLLLREEGEPIIQYVRELSYTPDNVRFCFNFVLDCVMKWKL